MSAMNERQISQLLSRYLDGTVDESDRAQAVHMIETDPNIRKQYQDLRRTRDLLARRAPLPESPWLPERVMNRIRDAQARGEAPLPEFRRFGPIPASMLGIAILALVAFAWTQREDIIRYISDTGTHVQMAYEDSILEGWIMPLFQRTSRDQVLEYAMFGTLPLDAEDGTVLRVDESNERGFRVDLARDTTRSAPAATVADLYARIQPTATQRKIFDTLFHYAQRQLEASVLTKQNTEFAIDPSISRFNTVILSGIAANLDDAQLARFEHFLEERDAAYTFVARRLPSAVPQTTSPINVADRFRTVRPSEEYVVLTDDRASVVRLGLDMDSLRRLMQQLDDRIPRIDMRVRELVRNLANAQPATAPSSPSAGHEITVAPAETADDRPVISIRIEEFDEQLRAVGQELEAVRERIIVLRRDGARRQNDGERIMRERARRDARFRHGEEATPRIFPRPPISPSPDHEIRRRIRIFVEEDSGEVRRTETDSIVVTDPDAPRGFRRVVPVPPVPLRPEFDLRAQPVPPARRIPARADTSIEI